MSIGVAGQAIGLLTPNLALYEKNATTMSLTNAAQTAPENLGAPTGRGPTLTVVGYDQPAYVQAQADFVGTVPLVCTGVNDQVIINSAFTLMATLPNGGEVHLI